jgi:hypothetical protein
MLPAGHELVQGRLLEGHAEHAADGRGLGPDVEAEDACRPRGRAQKRGQDPHGGRLAGAVAAEEAEDLTLGDGEADAPQRLDAGGLVALGQVEHLDGGSGAHVGRDEASRVNTRKVTRGNVTIVHS